MNNNFDNNSSIHWFPGHMKKALIEIKNKISIVDLIIEIVDARAPLASRNNQLVNLSENKDRLIVMSKFDMADPKISKEWEHYFKNNGYSVIGADLNNSNDILKIINKAKQSANKKREKEIRRGLKPQPIRAMIVGIPNVGKSTLINKIAKRKAASVENKPGHTRSQQWIKVSQDFELLDTPGILPSIFNEKQDALIVALIGSINENILPNDQICEKLIPFLLANYKSEFLMKYKIDCSNELDNNQILIQICIKRGLLTKNEYDIEKAETLLLNDFKKGNITRCTLEKPSKD